MCNFDARTQPISRVFQLGHGTGGEQFVESCFGAGYVERAISTFIYIYNNICKYIYIYLCVVYVDIIYVYICRHMYIIVNIYVCR